MRYLRQMLPKHFIIDQVFTNPPMLLQDVVQNESSNRISSACGSFKPTKADTSLVTSFKSIWNLSIENHDEIAVMCFIQWSVLPFHKKPRLVLHTYFP